METAAPPGATNPRPSAGAFGRGRSWPWAAAAVLIAALPLSPAFIGSRIFYIRDLSLYFWGRFLWLRHAWQAGSFPLWDPYVGGGQAAVADALHQMFLLPAIVLRLLGSDLFGFNLWIAAPFPLAAAGAWLWLSRRHAADAAALGAIVFALCGPVYSTSNFPNMSWSVAAIPWLLWAADRLIAGPTGRRAAVLALATSLQAFAGEPVTMAATLVLVMAYVAVVGAPGAEPTPRWRPVAWTLTGLAIGLGLAAVQLLPMAAAAAASERAQAMNDPLFWSLHPLALLETVAPHLFGNYYDHQSLATIPWVPVVNSGREPFLFSVYLGVPVLTLAVFAIAGSNARRWVGFWVAAAVLALIGAFGTYTPIYPFVRAHVPLLESFRFPAKYAVVAAIAVAAVAASGWETLTASASTSGRRSVAARRWALAFVATVGAAALLASALVIFAPTPAAFRFYAIAKALGSADPVGAAEFMLKGLPAHAAALQGLTLVTALIFAAAASVHRTSAAARALLFLIVAGDLVVRAWPINPAFDPSHLGEPAWASYVAADGDARVYIGGKRDGTLDASDPDSSRGFLNPPGLRGSASRAALSGQTAFYPSAWQAREMLSYDLAVLWPRRFTAATKRFLASDAEVRDTFLRRTGVRYRIVPRALAGERVPLVPIPYYLESFLYDWGGEVVPRVRVVDDVDVEPDPDRQLDALFAPGRLGRVFVSAAPAPAGRAGAPQPAGARVAAEESNRLTISAQADTAGGYLVVLDSYDDGWDATVDGVPAPILRANGLFRAVRLAPGAHQVTFSYRPAVVSWSAGVSVAVLVVVVGLLILADGSNRRSALVAASAASAA